MRTLILDVLILVMVAAAAEAAIRWFEPRYMYHRMDAQFTRGYPQAVNPDGSRGPSVRPEKPEGSLRILCLGDSTTFGTGVPADRTFAARLGPLLAARDKRPVESISAGAPGYAVKDLDRWLREHWSAYKPDVVVLAVTGNCVSWAWVRRDEPANFPVVGASQRPVPAGGARKLVSEAKDRLREARGALALPNFLKLNAERMLYRVGLLNHLLKPDLPLGVYLAYGWEQANLPPGLPAAALDAFDEDMDAFLATAAELGVPVIVTVIPPSFTISALPIDNGKSVPRERLSLDFDAHVRDWCRQRGVPYADIPAAIRQARARAPHAKLYLLMDYLHLDRLGHEIAAGTIAGSVAR